MQEEGKKLEVPTYSGPFLYEAVARKEPRLRTASEQALKLVREVGVPRLKSKEGVWLEDRVAELVKSRLARFVVVPKFDEDQLNQYWHSRRMRDQTDEESALARWKENCRAKLNQDLDVFLPKSRYFFQGVDAKNGRLVYGFNGGSKRGDQPNVATRVNLSYLTDIAVQFGRCFLEPDFDPQQQGISLQALVDELPPKGDIHHCPTVDKTCTFLVTKGKNKGYLEQEFWQGSERVENSPKNMLMRRLFWAQDVLSDGKEFVGEVLGMLSEAPGIKEIKPKEI